MADRTHRLVCIATPGFSFKKCAPVLRVLCRCRVGRHLILKLLVLLRKSGIFLYQMSHVLKDEIEPLFEEVDVGILHTDSGKAPDGE